MPIHTESGWKLTYEDYAKIPDDGMRHEIIDGEHIVNPAPVPDHQEVSGNLYFALRVLKQEDRAKVYYAPIDVHLSLFDLVQPDLIAIATKSKKHIGAKKIEGPPELAVEILSPGTKRLDKGRKRELYEREGVLEYWIVDPIERTLVQHNLVDGKYQAKTHTSGTVASTAFPGFELDLDAIWPE